MLTVPDIVLIKDQGDRWLAEDLDTAAPATPVVRGAVHQTAAMELLQVAYLHAVVAAAGCSLAAPFPDRGTDWTLTHESTSHAVDTESLLKVQLKSTHQIQPDPQGESFAFSLKNEHFIKLAQSPVTITRILVVMIVPRDIEHWVTSEPLQLYLRHRAYWKNLEGESITGSARSTVRVPTRNVFDDISLCRIMQQIGRGEVPR